MCPVAAAPAMDWFLSKERKHRAIEVQIQTFRAELHVTVLSSVISLIYKWVSAQGAPRSSHSYVKGIKKACHSSA